MRLSAHFNVAAYYRLVNGKCRVVIISAVCAVDLRRNSLRNSFKQIIAAEKKSAFVIAAAKVINVVVACVLSVNACYPLTDFL